MLIQNVFFGNELLLLIIEDEEEDTTFRFLATKCILIFFSNL